jgi:hypothetical protein
MLLGLMASGSAGVVGNAARKLAHLGQQIRSYQGFMLRHPSRQMGSAVGFSIIILP